MAWTNLKTTFKDLVFSGRKKYNVINNADGTVSFDDVTEYTNKDESVYGSAEVNATNKAINDLMNTSALVEKGSGYLGQWFKYSDGTMICLVDARVNIDIKTPYQGLYFGQYRWFYPKEFVARPVTLLGQAQRGLAGNWGNISKVETNYLDVFIYDAVERELAESYFSMMAIGRWK